MKDIVLNDEFFRQHPFKSDSVAKFEYSLFRTPELYKEMDDLCQTRFGKNEESLMMKARIENETDPEALLNLMRKQMDGLCRAALQSQLLKHEDAVAPLILNKCLDVMQSVFIENAISFLMTSKKSYAQWLFDNYAMIRNEYMKSMGCLVLGCRGDETMIELLINELNRFEQQYPRMEHSQGPLIALLEQSRRLNEAKKNAKLN